MLNSPSEPSSFGEALTTKKTLVASSNTSLDRSVGILDILPFWVLMLLPKRLYKRRFLFTACICKFFFFKRAISSLLDKPMARYMSQNLINGSGSK